MYSVYSEIQLRCHIFVVFLDNTHSTDEQHPAELRYSKRIESDFLRLSHTAVISALLTGTWKSRQGWITGPDEFEIINVTLDTWKIDNIHGRHITLVYNTIKNSRSTVVDHCLL